MMGKLDASEIDSGDDGDMPAFDVDSEPPPGAADARLAGLRDWLTTTLGLRVRAIAPVSGDASFRRYFRVTLPDGSAIAMDAPPSHEDNATFLTIDWLLRDLGLQVPEILEMDLSEGYLLLSDFGDTQLLQVLNTNNVDQHYQRAMDDLERLQLSGPRDTGTLPAYDEALLRREMDLFSEWLCQRHLGIDVAGRDWWTPLCDLLVESALAQPKVCVHRDYHSRNLMVLDDDGHGILDFQDAVIGPITYDLVSLLRDCYVRWSPEQVAYWSSDYFRRDAVQALVGEVSEETWQRWFDLMGVQRHLKASGIFARLWHRDGKRGYLADIPRTLGYIAEAATHHAELAPLGDLIRDDILPRLEADSANP